MHFIEQIFGFSPDAGSGAFEFVLFLIPIAGIYWLYRKRAQKKNSTLP
jgi:cbb3-type cytochrome oxidase subunit 3